MANYVYAVGDWVTRERVLVDPCYAVGELCDLAEKRLFADDTMFLQGCDHTEFPGGDPKQLYGSLTDMLLQVPDDAVHYPGHAYDPLPHASMGETRQSNPVFRPKTEAEWLAMFA